MPSRSRLFVPQLCAYLTQFLPFSSGPHVLLLVGIYAIGQGTGVKVVGPAYGDVYEPYVIGSAGGSGASHDQLHGGRGGGVLWFNITNHAHIDGTISSSGGEALEPKSGGGSGGSVWIHCNLVTGYGKVTAYVILSSRVGIGSLVLRLVLYRDLSGVLTHPTPRLLQVRRTRAYARDTPRRRRRGRTHCVVRDRDATVCIVFGL